MPRNTATGIVLAAFSTAFGFAMIWYIWWLALLSFIAIVAYAIFHTFDYQREFHVTQDEVFRTEAERTRLLGAKTPLPDTP